jgi:hypothetical protein
VKYLVIDVRRLSTASDAAQRGQRSRATWTAGASESAISSEFSIYHLRVRDPAHLPATSTSAPFRIWLVTENTAAIRKVDVLDLRAMRLQRIAGSHGIHSDVPQYSVVLVMWQSRKEPIVQWSSVWQAPGRSRR